MAPRPIHPTLVISAVFLLLVVWIERGCGLSASGEEVDDVGEGVVVADVAGEHRVGVPTASGAASMGRKTDTMPGNSWPMTSARRMPGPRTATS